jgi:hypothetical protein
MVYIFSDRARWRGAKIQFILQKKISRLDFLFSSPLLLFFCVRESPKVDFFFINGKRKEIKIEFKICVSD